jgi:DNA-binding transcriptional MocR family regulator
MNRNGPTFLYKQLAADFESRINGGTYQPGERLPSIRVLQRQLQVSPATVYQAYVELESLGLIEARPKSGYYVKPVRLHDLPAPRFNRKNAAPRKVNLTSMMNAVVAAAVNPDLVPLGASTLSRELLPARQLSGILKGLGPKEFSKLLNYSLSEGSPELRRQLVRQYTGLAPELGPDDFIITNGCTEAIALSLLALVKPGDVVAIESPTHFGFLQLLKEMGLLVVETPTDPQLGVDIEALEKVIRHHPVKVCLFMPNFHNPLGALMPPEHKEKLVRLLNRHDLPVIEDDIYGEMYFQGQRPPLLKSFDRKDLVITCSSFSKVLAPGFRVGWVIPGRRFKEKIQALKGGFSISASTLEQHVLAGFLAGGAYDRYLRTMRNSVKNQVLRIGLAVQKYFPPGLRMAMPQGGPMLWIELPEPADGLDLYYRALDHNIAIVPGLAFSGSVGFRRHIRLGCGTPFSERLDQALRTLGDLVRAACLGKNSDLV